MGGGFCKKVPSTPPTFFAGYHFCVEYMFCWKEAILPFLFHNLKIYRFGVTRLSLPKMKDIR